MKTSLVAVGISFVLALGCSSPERSPGGGGGSTGTGGSTATGGSTGTGGTSATGGDTGAGGTTATGGDTGTGGSIATGGDTGTGGSMATGGSTGAGGSMSTGGTTGNGGSTGTGGSVGAGGSTAAGGSTGAGGSSVPTTYTGKPYGGTPQPIPGTIQIESYDTGGSGVAYKASGNGHGNLCGVTRTDVIDLQCTGQNGSPTDQTQGTCAKLTGDSYLGYIGTGDWLNYTVNVQQAGTYAITTHVGVAGNTTKLMFTFTPTMKTAALPLMGTSGCGVESYHVWATESIGTIALQPGTYVMRLDFVSAGLNIDWVAFTKM
ncbi:MAG TPA: carbohydrate-binding domain-containing protein [Polyangia bacterium]|nr:carbohydrate-binding domain-containing protein [Polyangia bacterium]